MLTPPWFDFQFQGALVTAVARGGVAAALALNLYLWHVVVPRRPAAPERARSVRFPGASETAG